MATETAADPNVDPWRLYVDELKFAAAYTKDIDAAEELLLDGLGRGWIRWVYSQLDYGNDSCNTLYLEQVRKALSKAGRDEEMVESYLDRVLQFFWRREHSHITVKRAKSGAMRVGLPWVVGSRIRVELIDGKLVPVEQHWPIYLTDLAPVTLTAKLFKLHHGDVTAMLFRFGLLLPPPKDATSQAPAQVSSPAARKLTPAEWLVQARELPKRRGESRTNWLNRLYELHLKADLSDHWTKPNLSRRLYDTT